MGCLFKFINQNNKALGRAIHINWISPTGNQSISSSLCVRFIRITMCYCHCHAYRLFIFVLHSMFGFCLTASYTRPVPHFSSSVECGISPSTNPREYLLNYKYVKLSGQNEGLCKQYFRSPSSRIRASFENDCRIWSLNNTVPLTSWGYVRHYSDCPKQNSAEENKETVDQYRVSEEFQHEEIVGPTVERDTSAVATELREELNQLRKTIYVLSKGLAVLGLAHLTCGVWLQWVTKGSPFSEVSVQSFFAFSFPFTFAYFMRQALKPMTFFTKMEERGRLQILTLSLQATKGMKFMFQRVNAVVILCAAGISIRLLLSAWSS